MGDNRISMLDLETDCIKLQETLLESDSLHYKRSVFIKFFHKIIEQKNQDIYRSYYIQFAPFFSSLTDNFTSSFYQPQYYKEFLSILTYFEKSLGQKSQELLKHSRENLIAAYALAFLYLGEPHAAAKVVGVFLPDHFFRTPGNDQVD